MEYLMGAPPDIVSPRLEPLRYTCLTSCISFAAWTLRFGGGLETYGINGGS